jgi:nucleoid-associated protein YgaU
MTGDNSQPGGSDACDTMREQAAMSPASKAGFVDVPLRSRTKLDETTIHVVAEGDTLSGIAAHFYGDANAGKLIFDANRDQLTDPDRIKPGQMLKIPAKP